MRWSGRASSFARIGVFASPHSVQAELDCPDEVRWFARELAISSSNKGPATGAFPLSPKISTWPPSNRIPPGEILIDRLQSPGHRAWGAVAQFVAVDAHDRGDIG